MIVTYRYNCISSVIYIVVVFYLYNVQCIVMYCNVMQFKYVNSIVPLLHVEKR